MITPNPQTAYTAIEKSVNTLLKKRKRRVDEEAADMCAQRTFISSEITSVGEVIHWIPTTSEEAKRKRMKINEAEQSEIGSGNSRETFILNENSFCNSQSIEEMEFNEFNEEHLDPINAVKENLSDMQLNDANFLNCKLFAVINREISSFENNQEELKKVLENVVELINQGADVNAADREGRTPFLRAVQLGNIDLVKLLAEKGANPYRVDKNGKSSVDYAMELEKSEMLDLLQEKVPDITQPVRSKTCLHKAIVERKNSQIIQSLMKESLVDEIDENRDTALMLAIQTNQLEIAFQLLDKTKNIEQINTAERSVLHELMMPAIFCNKNEIWQNLYDRLSFKISEKLFKAIKENDLINIKKLFFALNPENLTCYSALSEAIEKGNTEAVCVLVELLKRYKIDINYINPSSKETPFMVACTCGFPAIVACLIGMGADLTARDLRGNNGFHLLAGRGHIDALKVCIYKALKVHDVEIILPLLNVENNEGLTPVMCAAKGTSKECVDFLTSAGSNATTQEYLATEVNWHQKHFDEQKKGAQVRYDLAKQKYDEEHQKTLASIEADQSNSSNSLNAAPAPEMEVINPPALLSIQEMLKRTPLKRLYHACKFGLTEVVKNQLKNGAFTQTLNTKVEEINYAVVKDKLTEVTTEETALYVSCYYGHQEIVKELLAFGANPNLPARNGWSPLFVAAKKGFFDIVKMLIAQGANPHIKNRNDMTPLNIAAYGGYLEIVQELINQKANVDQGDKMGAKPLHAAVQSGKYDVVKRLLENGADINGKTATDITPLYVASYSGNEQMVKMFLEYTPPASHANTLKSADVNWMNKEGLTAITVAAFNGHVGIVKKLLEAGADLTITAKKKVTPLYAACQNGHTEVVKLLLDLRVDPNAQIGNHNTPVHAAAIENKCDILEMLIRNGANVDSVNMDGVTPLYMACEKGHIEILEMLINAGANVNTTNKHIVSPLNIASQNGHQQVVKKLIDCGANVNSQTEDGPTPIFIAAQNGHLEICKMLIGANAQVDLLTKEKETALFVAGYFGHVEIVKALIDAGAQINIVDRDERTPLWWASKAGRDQVVKLLMDAGADVNLSDREGVTPIEIASQHHRNKVCEQLNSSKLQDTLCSICLTTQRTILFMPCKHLASCTDCFNKMERNARRTREVALIKCPICRDFVTEGIKVYF